MLALMFDQLRADGYKRVMFASATFLTHTRAMHESAGFTDMPQPDDVSEAWRDCVYVMERALN